MGSNQGPVVGGRGCSALQGGMKRVTAMVKAGNVWTWNKKQGTPQGGDIGRMQSGRHGLATGR